jgi:hypothetical protein
MISDDWFLSISKRLYLLKPQRFENWLYFCLQITGWLTKLCSAESLVQG